MEHHIFMLLYTFYVTLSTLQLDELPKTILHIKLEQQARCWAFLMGEYSETSLCPKTNDNNLISYFEDNINLSLTHH